MRTPRKSGRCLPPRVSAAFCALAIGSTLLAVPAAAQWDERDDRSKKPAQAPAKDQQPAKKDKKKLDPAGVFTPAPAGAKPDGAEGEAVPQNRAWSIVLVVFRGEDQAQLARLALAKVRGEGGLPDAHIEKRGDSTAVAYGQFESANSPEAVNELKRVQDMVVGTPKQQPYQFALLSPPVNKPMEGSIPEYNLVTAKSLMGADALYTLQVGVYGRQDLNRPTEADLAESRKAAEQAVVRLRQEGEQAFYYHGPRMSMVTIGVFDEHDFDPQVPSYKSPRLTDIRKRHPYNLYNGTGITENKPGRRQGLTVEQKLQTSTLVKIPEK